MKEKEEEKEEEKIAEIKIDKEDNNDVDQLRHLNEYKGNNVFDYKGRDVRDDIDRNNEGKKHLRSRENDNDNNDSNDNNDNDNKNNNDNDDDNDDDDNHRKRKKHDRKHSSKSDKSRSHRSEKDSSENHRKHRSHRHDKKDKQHGEKEGIELDETFGTKMKTKYAENSEKDEISLTYISGISEKNDNEEELFENENIKNSIESSPIDEKE